MCVRSKLKPAMVRRRVAGIKVMGPKVISKVFTRKQNANYCDGRLELDSHADTFVAGKNCQVMHYTERVCDVMPYSDEYEVKEKVPIVQAATGYTASNGQRYILIFNEALWMPELENSLMNPNQLRHHGIEVQDNPYHRDPMVIKKEDEDEGFIACLKSEGTNIFIDTWTPRDKDLAEYPHIVLTSSSEWNPQEVMFPQLLQSEVDQIEGLGISSIKTCEQCLGVPYDDPYTKPMRIFDIKAFNARLMKVGTSTLNLKDDILTEEEMRPQRTFISKQRHTNTTPEDLSEIWNISVEQARMTLEATTQHYIRSAIVPLSRRHQMD